jgi:hypothetical protein
MKAVSKILRRICLFPFISLVIFVFLHSFGYSGDKISSPYPIHRNVKVTVFWIGERSGGKHSRSNNTVSAWDKHWIIHYGGIDTPHKRWGYKPMGFLPRENPFYVALPYNDFGRRRKPSAYKRVYWAKEKKWQPRESMCKNRWVKIMKNGKVAYAQWEDVGPFENNDVTYVFGTRPPRSRHAGLDVSPAVRDYLSLKDVDTINWQFVPTEQVPDGPWKEIITISQTYWE